MLQLKLFLVQLQKQIGVRYFLKVIASSYMAGCSGCRTEYSFKIRPITVCGNISYFSYRKGIERFNHVASSYSRETFNPCKTGLEHQYGRRHVHQYDVTSCQNALAIFHIIIILTCIVPYQSAKVNSRKGEPQRCVREVYEHVDTSLWCSYSPGCTKYLRSV